MARKFKLHTGETYVEVVFIVKSRNVRGIPKTLELVEDEQIVEVKEGMEFITGWIKEKIMVGTI